MIRARTEPKSSTTTLMQYSDTGESGESYDVDVQTLPWSMPRRLSHLGSRSSSPIRNVDDSESGEAYEAEAQASQTCELRDEANEETERGLANPLSS
jgi:sulfite reductase alpha subunit-like flavoprotein